MKKLLLFCLLIGLALSMPIIVYGQKVIKIDCDSPAFVPDPSWKVDESTQKAGTFIFNPATVKLVTLAGPRSEVKGQVFGEKMKLSPCSAHVLDYLLAHQELIPESWKDKTIVFTGTVYRDPSGNKLYRTMIYWDGLFSWSRCYFDEVYENCAAIVAN